MSCVAPLNASVPTGRLLNTLRRRKIAAEPQAVNTSRSMFIFLIVVTASYWYCLPVVTQGIVRYSEFRGYDFLLLLLMGVLITRYPQKLLQFFRADISGRWIFRFSLWASATYPVTVLVSVIEDRASWALVTLVFLFHLWGFVFVYAAVRMFATTRRHCLGLLDLFLILGSIEAAIICLQGLSILPRFWSDIYSGYGTMAFSGTLGPNRTMPGHAMIMVLGVAFAYGRNLSCVGVRRGLLAAVAATLGLVALAMTASRTAWAIFAVLLFLTLLIRRPQITVLAFILLVGIGVIAFIPQAAEKRIMEIYQWRVASKLDKPDPYVSEDEGGDPVSTLQKLDARRVELWTEGAATIITERPYLIPFGGGFNNYRYTVEVGVSAHNLYITLVGEVGIIGLFLYLRWLHGLWKESSILKTRAARLKRRGVQVFFPFEMQTLLLAFMVSLLAGEILYPYRPAFTCMGMFLLLCALLNNPALVVGDAVHTDERGKEMTRPGGASSIRIRSGQPVRKVFSKLPGEA